MKFIASLARGCSSCLLYELRQAGLLAEAQVALPVVYKTVSLEAGYRLDIVVEKSILLEIKSVEQLLPIHRAQVLTYLKLSGLHIGLLINFNAIRLKDGIVRLVRNLPE